jgi:hypothetical protein
VAFCFGLVRAILPSSYGILGVKDMECRIEDNMAQCTCSYEPCSRKGKCCECIRYHLRMDELPGCVFPPQAERTYDRSIAHFVRINSRR